MRNYTEALSFLMSGRTARSRHRRKLENNTWLEFLPNRDIGVRLHRTYVVTYHPDNSCTLNSGGYRTATTKKRINAYAPVTLTQRGHRWYVNGVPFADGMRIERDRSVQSEIVLTVTEPPRRGPLAYLSQTEQRLNEGERENATANV